ncbi:MAG: O-antigen ligase family protein [Ignavibacteria bacterium]|nr:O-antigen ligase family protein [Ignavibacteria bacterium]
MIESRFNTKLTFIIFTGIIIFMMISLFALQVFIALLSLLWIFEKYSNKRAAFDSITFSVILFGVVRLVAILFSKYPELSYESIYKEAHFYFGFLSMSFYIKVFDDKNKNNLISLLVLTSAVVALIGIIQFNLSYVTRAQSITSGYTTFATYLAAVLPFAFLIQPQENFKYKKAATITFQSLIITGIILSLGRISILAAVIIVLIFLLSKKIQVGNLLLVVMLVSMICAISFWNNRGELSNRLENPAAPSDRDILYKGAATIIFERPILGFGPRTFVKIFPYLDKLGDKNVREWHNQYLQIYIESGLIGILAFGFIFYVYYKYLFQIRKKLLKAEEKAIGLGLILSGFVFLFTSLTSDFIASPILSILFAFYLALVSQIKFKTEIN